MSALLALLAGLFKTLFVRLPLGIWLAVLCCGAWVAAERHYGAEYPLLPITNSWPVQAVNPTYPEDPSRVPQLVQLIEQAGLLSIGFEKQELAFGEIGYGVLLGATFGLLIAGPCGVWKTLRNYSGLLMFPIRIIALAVCYAALYGILGGWLASTFEEHLIGSAYLAAFGLATPLLVPFPFWGLRPLFPSDARLQAATLVKKARHEATTTLVGVAKHDPTLGDVTKGQPQQEWAYYATVCGVFIGMLLAEKRGVSAWRRKAVERQARKQLNKKFEKGEHGLTAVMQFSREQLDRGAKFTTEVIVGLWLAMQMKGDLNPIRDKELASSLGAHLVQGMHHSWSATSNVGTVLGAMLLWTGVAGLAFVALEPVQAGDQLARLGVQVEGLTPPAQPVAEQNEAEYPSNEVNETVPAEAKSTDTEAIVETKEPILPPVEAAVSPESPAESAADPVASPTGETTETPNTNNQPVTEPVVAIDPMIATAAATDPVATPEETTFALATRRWTHTSGRKIEAVAKTYWNGSVELERADGKSAFVEIAKLDQSDRQVIYERFAISADTVNFLPGSLITRTWTAATTSREVTAALVKVSETNVALLRADGKLFTMPLAQLSEADQAFAKEQRENAPSQK